MTLSAATLVGFAVLAATCGAQRPEDAPLKQLAPGSRIAVVTLDSYGGADVDRVVGEILTNALRQAGMKVLERSHLDAVLREQRLVREGVVDPKSAVSAGKVLGARYLIGAKATEFGVRDDRIGGGFGLGSLGGLQIRTTTARVVLEVRLLDAQTGEILLTDKSEGRQVNNGATLLGGTIANGRIALGAIDIGSNEWSQSLLGKASRKAVDALIKRLVGASPVAEGRVLAVAPDGVVVIDLGSFDGLRVGDRLSVLRLESVRDSQGTAVWTDERELGYVRIVEVRGDRAKAEFIGTGPPPAEGDVVRPF